MNGMVADPETNTEERKDLLVENGKISKVGAPVRAPQGALVIDAAGTVILPGLVDMHVHLREPGREDKETIRSGSLAAIKGGFTSVLAMPNTDPALDTPERIKSVGDIIRKTACCGVYPSACITLGRKGAALTDLRGLKEAGAIAVTDDGSSVDNPDIMRAALQEAVALNLPVIAHCEDKELSAKGVVNKGFISTSMGLRGISKESEFSRIERDIGIAEACNARLHIAHVSCAESVEIIAKAKKRGVRVTAETAPHYIALTENEVIGYDPNYKMNPPLRSTSDRTAIRQGLCDGTIDAIATDHAPHTENEKEIEFERAEFGVVGLETALSVCVTELVATGYMKWPGLARVMSYNPSRILGIGGGTLCAGAPADITVVAPDRRWVVRRERLVSKSKNSPFLNRELKGVVVSVLRQGELVYSDDGQSCSALATDPPTR